MFRGAPKPRYRAKVNWEIEREVLIAAFSQFSVPLDTLQIATEKRLRKFVRELRAVLKDTKGMSRDVLLPLTGETFAGATERLIDLLGPVGEGWQPYWKGKGNRAIRRRQWVLVHDMEAAMPILMMGFPGHRLGKHTWATEPPHVRVWKTYDGRLALIQHHLEHNKDLR